MIKHDTVSRMLTVLACLITVYLTTFQTANVVLLYPVVLLILGIVLQRFILRKVEETDSIVQNRWHIMYYTSLALIGLALTNLYVRTYLKQSVQFVGMNALLFSVMMAISETLFFQGFLTNFFVQKLSPVVGLFVSSLIFTVFHFAVYGLDVDSLTYIFVGGFILNWVAYKSGRLSPPMLAHIMNNVVAVMT